MELTHRGKRPVDARRVVEVLALQLARGEPDAAVVFDADGTLWLGDVADDLLHVATSLGALRDAARPALADLAAAHGLATRGTATDLTLRIRKAAASGQVPEVALFEAMTCCYAGLTTVELDQLARQAVTDSGLAHRRQTCIVPVLDWARELRLRTLVVSASPEPVVRAAAAQCGFSPTEVVGARPLVLGDVILPRLACPIPYEERKVAAARSLIGSSRWLAAFGDSAFELPMLRAAEVAVAVRPKAKLLRELGCHPDAWILQ